MLRDAARHPDHHPGVALPDADRSRPSELFEGARWCIVDEIHAVAATKRGAHLALTLERLTEAAGDDVAADRPVGHASPLEEIARFMVGPRASAGSSTPASASSSTSRSRCRSSRWSSRTQPGADSTRWRAARPPARSIWPAIYPELLELIRAHRSTIVFVNNRRGAERARRSASTSWPGEDARPRPPRLAGARGADGGRGDAQGRRAPCLVATSSLELGIDMGAVDLVIQVESPNRWRAVCSGSAAPATRSTTSAAAGSSPSSAPTCWSARWSPSACARRDRDHGRAPQRARRARSADRGDRRRRPEIRPWPSTTCYALVTRHLLLCGAPPAQFENVLDMLDGRYPSSEFAELRPRIVWDRVKGTIRARRGARQLAVTNAGTIPDRGLYAVTLPDGRARRRARRGDGLRGPAGTDVPARSEHVADRGDRPRSRDRHAGAGIAGRGAVLEGRQASGGRRSSARRSARLPLGGRPDRRGSRGDYDLDDRAAAQPCPVPGEQQQATRVDPLRPGDRGGAVPRRDRRLAAVRPQPVRRPRPRRLGACAERRIREQLRARVRRHLVRRRDHRPPPRCRGAAAAPTWCCSTPKRSRS